MKKVLVVDDSAFNRTLLSAILRKKQLIVDFAEDGEAAVKKFAEYNPDVVFIDYVMPIKSGVDALREMKQLNPHFVGIMLTSISAAEDVQKAKEAGANGYILKPYQPEKIFEVLKKFRIIEE